MSLGVVIALLRHRARVQLHRFEVSVDLSQGRRAIGAESLVSVYVPERHLLLQRIDVDVQDLSRGAGMIDQWDPRHVAVDHQYDVGVRQCGVLTLLVPLHALVQRIVGREVYAARHGFQHTRAREAREPYELFDRYLVTPQV